MRNLCNPPGTDCSYVCIDRTLLLTFVENVKILIVSFAERMIKRHTSC